MHQSEDPLNAVFAQGEGGRGTYTLLRGSEPTPRRGRGGFFLLKNIRREEGQTGSTRHEARGHGGLREALETLVSERSVFLRSVSDVELSERNER